MPLVDERPGAHRRSPGRVAATALVVALGAGPTLTAEPAPRPGGRRVDGGELLELVRAGEYRRAEAILRPSLPRDPDGRLHFLLGVVLHRQLRWAEAEPFLRAAAGAQPARAPWLHALAQNHLELGRCREAMAVLERCLALDPDPGYRHDIAMCALNLGDSTRAEQELRTVLAAAPETGQTRSRLGRLLLDLGRDQEALAILSAAVDARPGDLEARFALGLAQRRTGALEAATATFETVLDALPTHVGAVYNLGQTLAARGEAEAGRAVLERFRALSELEDRIDNHRLYLRGHPGDVDARVSIGRLLLEAGRDEEALEQLRIARREAPGRSEIASLLATALRRQGRLREADDADRAAAGPDGDAGPP